MLLEYLAREEVTSQVSSPRKKYEKTKLQAEMERHRRRFVLKALKRNNWRVDKTATSLKMFSHKLYQLLNADPLLATAYRRGRKRGGIKGPWPAPQRSSKLRRSTSRKSSRV